MSPAKFNRDLHHEDSRKGEINDPRPSPLKINNDSHFIHKSSSSTMSSMSIGSSVSSIASAARQQEQQPIIIYTHSPKIIHTQARDFMALVQKLTGVSSSQSGDNINANKTTSALLDMEGNECNLMPVSGHDDNESTTAHANENFGGGDDLKSSSSAINDMPPIQNQTNQYSANMPLSTLNTTSFLCSPRPVFREPDSAYVLPNMGNSMSPPSAFEFMKGLSEY